MKYLFLAVAVFTIGYALPTLVVSVDLVLTVLLALGLLVWLAYYVDTRFPKRHYD